MKSVKCQGLNSNDFVICISPTSAKKKTYKRKKERTEKKDIFFDRKTKFFPPILRIFLGLSFSFIYIFLLFFFSLELLLYKSNSFDLAFIIYFIYF